MAKRRRKTTKRRASKGRKRAKTPKSNRIPLKILVKRLKKLTKIVKSRAGG